MGQFARLFHTVRHLRAKQIYYQLYYRLGRRWVARQALAPLPPVLAVRTWKQAWAAPMPLPPCHIRQGTFQFMGETGTVVSAPDWNDGRKPKLWLYNLHYLDDLNAAGADARGTLQNWLIQRWTEDNPPLAGNGWEPYPLSLRLVNLVKWYARQNEVTEARLLSLARQARALVAQLEKHILANHLFSNGKALTFVGAFFSGAVGDDWLRAGLRILDREVPAQFLADGGHFELSPMYHAALLWDLCDLLNLSRQSDVLELRERETAWREKVLLGLDWLHVMSHPDGEIAFFNDAAMGIAPDPKAVIDYAQQLGIHATENRPVQNLTYRHMQNSGYVAVEMGLGSKALLDVAEVGPCYQPGHAHADTLSFELSLFGQRVLVNSGTSVYGEGVERLRQRGTAAHNTIQIDEQDSSQVWAGFRVAKRARPLGLEIDYKPARLRVSCAHDGYRWLPGCPVHSREWLFMPGRLVVVDKINGKFRTAVGRFHLHPDVIMEPGQVLRLASGQRIHWSVRGGEPRTVPSTWHPEFGVSIANQCLEVRIVGAETTLELTWE